MKSLKKIFIKYKNKKLFIFSKTNFLTYNQVYNKTLMFASYLQNKHKSIAGKIIFLNIDRSVDYFIAILSLALLGATVVPISSKISSHEMNYLRKKYRPFLEISSINLDNSEIIATNKLYLKKAKIIFFTSGTTGKPKGILHNILSLVSSADKFSNLANYKVGKIVLHNWPHYYMAGFFNMFLCPLVSGCSIFFDEEIGINSYLKYWETLKDSKIDIAYLSPTMSQALITYSNYSKFNKKKPPLTKIISTGFYLYENTSKKFKETFGVNLINCYGVTEVGGSISFENKSFLNNDIGKLSQGVDIKLSKNNEILIKSNYMFSGYIESDSNFKKFTSKYFNSGDLGEYRKGKLLIVGRNKEIIKKGGEQVSLLKVEDVALGFRDVREVFAKGIPSEFWGEEIELFVVFDSNKKQIKTYNQQKIEYLRKHLLQKLMKLEMPKKITAVNYIPKTSIGKNYRRVY